jgi:hypothetical protein
MVICPDMNPGYVVFLYIVACVPGNATDNLWVRDSTLNLFDIRQAELQLIITLSILV